MPKNIEQQLIECLHRKGKTFLPLKEFTTALPRSIRKKLKINSATPISQLLAIFEDYLGQGLKIFKKRSIYLGFNTTPGDIILSYLKEGKGTSLKQLAHAVPFTLHELTLSLNTLLKMGEVYTLLRESDQKPLFLKRDSKPDVPLRQVEPTDREMFFNTYQTVGLGQSFVRIYRLREHLNWPKERFDGTLKGLMNTYEIELHPGDPSKLSEEQLENSYIDTDGELYITASWRGGAL